MTGTLRKKKGQRSLLQREVLLKYPKMTLRGILNALKKRGFNL
jgi:hypothetical protein